MDTRWGEADDSVATATAFRPMPYTLPPIPPAVVEWQRQRNALLSEIMGIEERMLYGGIRERLEALMAERLREACDL